MITSKLKACFTIISLLGICVIFAQNGNLKGKIQTKDNKDLDEFHLIISKDNNTVTESYIGKNGEFNVSIPVGTFDLFIENFGFEKVKKSINIETNKEINLGTIEIKNLISEKSLSDVTVVGKKTTIVNQIDRKVVNVGEDLASASADLSQVMNTVPGVFVNQDKQISLRGNSNVRLLIDGKPTTLTFEQIMQQYPPSSIEKIEVLTNPPAKYSPEGKSGIINIIPKKGKRKGTNINLDTSYTHSDTSKYHTWIDFNQNFGSINIFGNGGYGVYNFKNNGYFWNIDNQFRDDFHIDGKNIYRYGKLGLDYFINDKNTLSLYANFSGNNNDTNFGDISSNPITSQIIQNSDILGIESYTYQEYDAFYKHEFKKAGHKLEVEANYYKNPYKYDRKAYLNQNNIVEYSEIGKTTNQQKRFNIDYTLPISETAEFTAGAETRLTGYDEDYFKTTLSNTNFYNFDRNIYSLYSEYKKQWDRFGFKVGVRGEITTIKTKSDVANATPIDDNDFQLYPSAYLTYKLGKEKKTELNLNYSRRVDRPWEDLYSPLPKFSTGNIQQVGNDKIKPEFTNSFEAGISRNFEKVYFGLNVFYRDIKDQINQQMLADAITNKITLKNINTNGANTFGSELTLNYNPFKWWSINAGGELYFSKLGGYVGEEWFTRKVSNYTLRMNHTLSVDPTLNFQAFSYYSSKNKDLQGEYNDRWTLDLSVRKTFMNNLLSVSLRMGDVFNIQHSEWKFNRPLNQIGRSDWENQRFSVNVKINFASGKLKSTERKNREESSKKSGGLF